MVRTSFSATAVANTLLVERALEAAVVGVVDRDDIACVGSQLLGRPGFRPALRSTFGNNQATMAGRTITCPRCGNRGLTFDESTFEVRGRSGRNGMPVRMCVACGSGMTVHPSLFGAKAKLIDPVTWGYMKQSWDQQFGGEGEDDGEDDWLGEDGDDESEYPVVSCPYCDNTGSTEPGSRAFEYRVALGEPKVRMCRRCERGFWLYSETGESEPMSEESWVGIEMMHATLGGGAHVDAEWARREAEGGATDAGGESGDDDPFDLGP